jgi:hypothetical protein
MIESDWIEEGGGRATKRLKILYLIIFCASVASALYHGFQLALAIFFAPAWPAPWAGFRAAYYITYPIFTFLYIYCFIVSFPMLLLVQKYEEAIVAGTPRTRRKAAGYLAALIAGHVIVIGLTYLLVTVVEPIFMAPDHHWLWVYEMVAFALFFLVARFLPKFSSSVNNQVQEFHIHGYHVHESMFGLFFIFASILFIFNAVNTVDLIFAGLFAIVGGFFFGRDLKDVLASKFIEKIKDVEGTNA